MAKLTGAAKTAFLARMAGGRKTANKTIVTKTPKIAGKKSTMKAK
jgi:hypothetical protein